MPTDISLKAALDKSKVERLAATQMSSSRSGSMTKGCTMSMTGTASKRSGKTKAVYELYKDCETVVNMTVELHRKYNHPQNTPAVLPRKQMRGEVGDVIEEEEPASPSRGASRASSSRPQSRAAPNETALERRLRITPFARMVFVFKYVSLHLYHL